MSNLARTLDIPQATALTPLPPTLSVIHFGAPKEGEAIEVKCGADFCEARFPVPIKYIDPERSRSIGEPRAYECFDHLETEEGFFVSHCNYFYCSHKHWLLSGNAGE